MCMSLSMSVCKNNMRMCAHTCLRARLCACMCAVVHTAISPYNTNALDHTDGILTLALECFALFGMVFSIEDSEKDIESIGKFHFTLTFASVAMFVGVSSIAFAFMAREVLSMGQTSIFLRSLRRERDALEKQHSMVLLRDYSSPSRNEWEDRDGGDGHSKRTQLVRQQSSPSVAGEARLGRL